MGRRGDTIISPEGTVTRFENVNDFITFRGVPATVKNILSESTSAGMKAMLFFDGGIEFPHCFLPSIAGHDGCDFLAEWLNKFRMDSKIVQRMSECLI